MEKIIPSKLEKGDKIMVISPARGLKIISQETRNIAIKRLNDLGLEVVFADNTNDDNFDLVCSMSVEKRIADIHQAFSDKSVKGILTVLGGFNSNQLLPYLDYELIKNNPKIICGFSDVTALFNAISAKTGLVTYYGPHFSSFGMEHGFDYTLDYFVKALFANDKIEVKSSDTWSDDLWFINQDERDFIQNEGHWIINKGQAEGKIIGGNLGTYNLLLGTNYRSEFTQDTILLIEEALEETPLVDFERNMHALIYQDDFINVKGIVIGRFQKDAKIDRKSLEFILDKPELKSIPIIANVDFGHTTPIITIPLGGYAKISDGKISFIS